MRSAECRGKFAVLAASWLCASRQCRKIQVDGSMAYTPSCNSCNTRVTPYPTPAPPQCFACPSIGVTHHHPRQRQECDFEGRPTPTLSSRSSASPFPDDQCHMIFTGLKDTGHDLCSLRVTAHFGVDSVHKVGEGTGPIKASLKHLQEPSIVMVLHFVLYNIILVCNNR